MNRLTPKKVEELWLLNSFGKHSGVIQAVKSADWLSLIDSSLSDRTESKRYTGISFGMLILNSAFAIEDFDILVQFCRIFDRGGDNEAIATLQKHFQIMSTAYLSNRSFIDVESGANSFDVSKIKGLLEERVSPR